VKLSALRVATTLCLQRMPFDEILAVVTADDPEVVRRYLELHGERLQEWADGQRSSLTGFERSLTGR
jgi:hypothetical protein